MNKCPICGKSIKTSAQNHPWKEFEFNKESLRSFKLLLRKILAYYRFNTLMAPDRIKQQEYLTAWQNEKKRIPEDFLANSEAIRMGMNISLCATLEYFHKVRKAPRSAKRIKDTKTFSRFLAIRHFSAHIIDNNSKLNTALSKFRELNIEKIFSEIALELQLFALEGIEKYVEQKDLSKNDFGNTAETKIFTQVIDFNRKRLGKPLLFN